MDWRVVPLCALLALAHARFYYPEVAVRQNDLVETLRQQLMRDNYDYMSSEPDSPLHDRRAGGPEQVDGGPQAPEEDYFQDAHTETRPTPRARARARAARRERPRPPPAPAPSVPNIESNVPVNNKGLNNSMYDNLISDAKDLLHHQSLLRKDLTDLYYYMDENRLAMAQPLPVELADAPDVDYDETHPQAPEEAQEPTRRKKYTVLEMPGSGEGETRRSGARGAVVGGDGRPRGGRRFVQEEGSDGVAIVSLDDGPFPEFRLPGAHHRYMLEYPEADPPRAPLAQLSQTSDLSQDDDLAYIPDNV